MAEHGPLREAQHAGHPPALGAQRAVAEHVHAAMHGDEPARVPAMDDGLGAQAQRQQLPAGDRPVLGFGQPQDPALDVEFVPHMGT
jgi:hypothetical protein